MTWLGVPMRTETTRSKAYPLCFFALPGVSALLDLPAAGLQHLLLQLLGQGGQELWIHWLHALILWGRSRPCGCSRGGVCTGKAL